MMSIFNIFDPITSNNLSLNWLTLLFPIMFMPMNFWLIISRWNKMWQIIINFMNNEFNVILKKKFLKLILFLFL